MSIQKTIELDKEAKTKLLNIVASGLCTPDDQNYLSGLFKLRTEVVVMSDREYLDEIRKLQAED